MKNYFDQIENYLEGNLSLSEAKDFENAMAQNEELRKECRLREDLENFSQRADIMDLQAKLDDIFEQNQPQEKKAKVIRITPMISVAASIVLLFGIGLAFWLTRDVNVEKLYADNFETYESVVNARGNEANLNPLLSDGFTAYTNENYKLAKEHFGNYLLHNSGNLAVIFYKGICEMELEEYRDAIASFKTVIDHNNNLFVRQSNWYQALAYIKQQDVEKAIINLRRLKDTEGIYSEQAEVILKKLQ